MIASLILALHLLDFIPAGEAATFLFICGAALIVAEIALPSGIAAFNGVLALLVGYALKAGPDSVFGLEVGWGVFFGIAFVEIFILIASVILILRHRRRKATTGAEGMIGQKAAIVEWDGKQGRVRIQGEIWKAESDTLLELAEGEKVTISSINDLVLRVSSET
ncbi:MAG: NfeD family protein [Alphaproteobacteria bacterium]